MLHNNEMEAAPPGAGVRRVLLPLLWITLGGVIVLGLLMFFGLVERPDAVDGQTESVWTCPMHPEVIAEEPGSCPICGMDLVPVSRSTDSGAMPPTHESGGDHGAVVTIDAATHQNMNVTTARAERRDINHRIRTVGYLDYDQERMHSVTTKFSGFIEKTFVSSIGQSVVKGEPLFEVYSPDLVQTQQELLTAKKYADQMAGTGADAHGRAVALLEAARERLAYWDVAPEQILHLEETGVVQRTLQVVAPATGLIMKRLPGLEGMAVHPGLDLLHIADISRLWLNVDVFEEQLWWLQIGSRAEITMAYFPGKAFTARVRFIEPEVSEETRSIRLTLDVANRNHQLRVGMYATVVFEPTAAASAITVPSSAVLRTGERSVVIVVLGEGRFAPREVALGPEGEGFVQVLEGLDEGDQIVTSAQFLIDSESNLQEAIQKMTAGRGASGPQGHAHGS